MTDFLGIDVGASGLRAFTNPELEAISIDAPNSSAKREQDVIEMLGMLSERMPGSKFQRVCLGMSGFASLGVSAVAISQAIANLFGSSSIVTSDMVSAHYAHFGESDGATVVVGTGALSFAVAGSNIRRIDGLGATLGDFGSAHWIGISAMRRAVRAAELRGDLELLNALEEHLGSSSGWPRQFAQGEIAEFDVAKLSRVVDQQADLGQDLAIEIMSEAGQLAAESVLACAQAVGTKSIGFGGSVLLGSELAQRVFLETLESEQLEASPLRSASGIGCLALASAKNSNRLDQMVSHELAYQSESE